MIENERAAAGPGRRMLDTAEVMLVANDFAGAGGESLAVSALSFWGLPIEPAARRMRALVTGATSATSPLQWLCGRLVLLDAGLALEIVFPDAEPRDYDAALMPADAEWSWHRDSAGRFRLCDHIDLRPTHMNERHSESER